MLNTIIAIYLGVAANNINNVEVFSILKQDNGTIYQINVQEDVTSFGIGKEVLNNLSLSVVAASVSGEHSFHNSSRTFTEVDYSFGYGLSIQYLFKNLYISYTRYFIDLEYNTYKVTDYVDNAPVLTEFNYEESFKDKLSIGVYFKF